jgi:undecaprenyl-diphosphatase
VSPLYRLDIEWFRAINIGWHSPILDPIFAFLSYFGLGISEFFFLLALLVFKKARPYILPLIVTLLLASPMSQFPKHWIPRDRPSLLAFSHPQEPIYGWAFPSGHTTAAFAIAFMVLLLTYGTPRIRWAYLSFVVATLIAISRIYRGVHWPSDVIAGVFDGCLTAIIAYFLLVVTKRWPNLGGEEIEASSV